MCLFDWAITSQTARSTHAKKTLPDSLPARCPKRLSATPFPKTKSDLDPYGSSGIAECAAVLLYSCVQAVHVEAQRLGHAGSWSFKPEGCQRNAAGLQNLRNLWESRNLRSRCRSVCQFRPFFNNLRAAQHVQSPWGKEHRSMSCKIDRVVTDENLVALIVAGRITEEHVEILRSLLEQEAVAPAVDLQNVRLVDRSAVKLFALIEAKGSELRNCPLYVREWVTRETMTKDIEDA